jgi:hypothetical protein
MRMPTKTTTTTTRLLSCGGVGLTFLVVFLSSPAVGANGLAVTGDSPTDGSPASFEALAREAMPSPDLGTLLGPWTGKCDGERELDRARCRAARTYLRKALPGRSFSVVADDPAVIALSELDASFNGYHLSIAGCLACTRPVAVGTAREERLVTVKAPVKEGDTLRSAVELSRSSVGFDNAAEATRWRDQAGPELLTQFIFTPPATEWKFGSSRGYAVTLQGFRVFNRCTGEVVVSRPPSTDPADVVVFAEECRGRDAAAAASHQSAAGTGASTATLPPQLNKNDISSAMDGIRPRVFACFDRFKVPGLAQFDFLVGGDGTVVSVRLSGSFFGTPTGACVLTAAKEAHFPRFSAQRQHFVYPFFLRRH